RCRAGEPWLRCGCRSDTAAARSRRPTCFPEGIRHCAAHRQSALFAPDKDNDGRTSMRHLLTLSAAVLAAGVLAQPASAQTEEKGVPILLAPYHLPVFKNEYVTVLNVLVPPGRNTGYHTHTTD